MIFTSLYPIAPKRRNYVVNTKIIKNPPSSTIPNILTIIFLEFAPVMVVDGQKGPWAKSQGPEGMEAREVPNQRMHHLAVHRMFLASERRITSFWGWFA
jgi:hypothetical protein